MTPDELAAAVRDRVLGDFPQVEAVVLHGSRARGDARPSSDWDLAVLGTGADLAGVVTP
jgi:predicted nucleotidyltransferase